jgi:DNA-binding LytR/AlgR family response regulator
VEDMPSSLDLVSGYILRTDDLELAGTATNPLIALEEIKTLKPDVVFTDINMPEMSGIALAGLVDDFAQIVFISGEYQSSYKNMDWKDYLYLQKMVTYNRFLEIILQIRSGRT